MVVQQSALTLINFILAMTLYPEVQARAQAEIDRFVGDRLPTVSDRGRLPYVDAILKEALRWQPVNPNDGVRRTTKDDIYKGYFIPAGTLVMPDVR